MSSVNKLWILACCTIYSLHCTAIVSSAVVLKFFAEQVKVRYIDVADIGEQTCTVYYDSDTAEVGFRCLLLIVLYI